MWQVREEAKKCPLCASGFNYTAHARDETITGRVIWAMSEQPQREGVYYHRELGDGRELCVFPRIFNSILTIGPVDEDWYDTHYCYETPVQAAAAAEAWNPLEQEEPDGWFRHAASGRRRPGGDREKEYVRF